MKLQAIRLKSDRRRSESRLWQDWLDEAAQQASRFYNVERGDDPFAYGETASVGFLATAAARCGYLALPEFAVTKKGAVDRRERTMGRSDLWIRGAKERDWWFEFKQHFISRGSLRDLERKWDAASRCAEQVGNNGTSVAGLIVSFAWLKRQRPEKLQDARTVLANFYAERHHVWKIQADAGADDIGPETYIIFDVAREIGGK